MPIASAKPNVINILMRFCRAFPERILRDKAMPAGELAGEFGGRSHDWENGMFKSIDN
jgi:hypothetical protein